MTNSRNEGTRVGAQRPRLSWVPEFSQSTGQEAIEVCHYAGLHLDPWQQWVLANSLGERSDGKWAAFEVGVMVSRQNGKGSILEGRELVGLFLLGERLIVHSAHQFDTSLEAFRRLLELIENTPDFERRIKRVSRSHGEEGIELKGGQRIRFRTRTKGGGRGFSGDCLILDEAMILPDAMHGALLPTLSARPNPQVWYTGSAVDREVHEHGLVFARIRDRGLKGGDPALMYAEWSADAAIDDIDDEQATDEVSWADSNPGLGIRISPDYIEKEQRSMSARTFAVERLGVGAWPDVLADAGLVIDRETWKASKDPDSEWSERPALAFDVRPDRSASAIGLVGIRDDGRLHGEVVSHDIGTGWVLDRVIELKKALGIEVVLCDQRSPAAALLKQAKEKDLEVVTVDGSEYAQACGQLIDALAQDRFRHLGGESLDAAAKGAAKRPLGDAWAWSRKSSSVDICPLVAVTLALWGAGDGRPSVYEQRGIVTV